MKSCIWVGTLWAQQMSRLDSRSHGQSYETLTRDLLKQPRLSPLPDSESSLHLWALVVCPTVGVPCRTPCRPFGGALLYHVVFDPPGGVHICPIIGGCPAHPQCFHFSLFCSKKTLKIAVSGGCDTNPYRPLNLQGYMPRTFISGDFPS